MRVLGFALAILVSGLLGITPASAEKFALVIGNGAYSDQVAPLRNAVADAELMEGALSLAGFKRENIEIVRNVSRIELLKAVGRHAARLRAAQADPATRANTVGFLYYAGHGLANPDTQKNYLIPVDVARMDDDVWYSAVALSDIVSEVQRAAPDALHVLVFDACRSELRMGTRGGGGFFAEQQRPGVLIAFSTDVGQVAYDGSGVNGPYASALATQLIDQQRRRATVLFDDVKFDVYAAMEGRQFPWHISKFTRPFYFHDDGGAAAGDGGGAAPGEKRELGEVAKVYSAVQQHGDEATLNAFADRYSETVFAESAKAAAAEKAAGGSSGNQQVATRAVRADDDDDDAPSAVRLPDAQKLGDYFVILGSYGLARRGLARRESRRVNRRGLETYVIKTDNYSNLRDGYWTVVEGPFTLEEARRRAAKIREGIYPSVYVKKG